MSDSYTGKERRRFFRYRHEKPVHFRVVIAADKKDASSSLIEGISKNLSASGVLFSTTTPPGLSSILLLDLDYRTSNICREIEEGVFIINNQLLGKVVRIEDAGNDSYDIGIAFIKKSDDLPDEIKVILKETK